MWRGLVVDSEGRHYRRMKSAVWLYLYLIIHADRLTGRLVRKYETIAFDMEVPSRTIRRWMMMLRRNRYIDVESTGRSMVIHIRKWKSSSALPRVARSRP